MSLQLISFAVRLNDRILIAPFDLEIAKGEIITVMGPSGSGKTSLLSAIAGTLEPPLNAEGECLLNGRRLNPLSPERRRIGRLFQDDVLFPHMTVGENILFGMPRGSAPPRVEKMHFALAQSGLADFANRAPHTLSGGQRQRVALLRMMLNEPDAALLDEPFSKLDHSLRATMRNLTFDNLREAGTPALLVTHDHQDRPQDGRCFHITAEGKLIDV